MLDLKNIKKNTFGYSTLLEVTAWMFRDKTMDQSKEIAVWVCLLLKIDRFEAFCGTFLSSDIKITVCKIQFYQKSMWGVIQWAYVKGSP